MRAFPSFLSYFIFIKVPQFPADTKTLLISSAWELRRSLASSQNVSLPTFDWIFYLFINSFFFAGNPSPESLPWLMTFCSDKEE